MMQFFRTSLPSGRQADTRVFKTMPKKFLRIVTLVLVPCLLADPALAGHERLLPTSPISPMAVFGQEALVAMAAGATRYIFSPIRATNASVQRSVRSATPVTGRSNLAQMVGIKTFDWMNPIHLVAAPFLYGLNWLEETGHWLMAK